MRFPRMLDGGNPTELRAKAQHARKLADRADELVDRLREEAERARFYAQMLLHRFRDPVTADRLRAVAADLERQAAARVAAALNRHGTS